ncbi:hypothetical protein HPP92_012627 [Vanilla planifolia]|uniref:Uncharacterized protein n=1 Tax=Vanilla planifolia TaxID=51239 RepID=A0A835UXZ7_VANPL|nr:hypothetical protein HPP92_013039 [Vanilla planifolia]KAG0477908.1 hypothetical protein HPP92_012627 [Vanilla planifolia]
MGRYPCAEKTGLKKGPWTREEDQKLLAYIEEHGHGSWRALPSNAGLDRCGKSCRLRWTNYLRPDIKRGKFTTKEEQTIIQLHALLGNRWSAIATHLPRRTDNEIKNYWNTHLKKRLTKMGIDPVTHKPNGSGLSASAADGQSKCAASLNHMAQWENARLEAESRLVQESNHRRTSVSPPSAAFPSPPPAALPPSPSPYLDVLREWLPSTLHPTENTMPLTVHQAEEEWKCLMKPPGCFAGMLLGDPNEPQSGEGGDESDMAEGGTCVEEEVEENKNYWNRLLNLVNSSSPSNSPPAVF